MKKLSPSMQNHMKCIYELSFGGAGVRVCDIAEKADVSKASACISTKNLESQDFVYRDTRRRVYLIKVERYKRKCFCINQQLYNSFLKC